MIRVRNLAKEYPGGVEALRGVDVDIAVGEFVALVGPSGAGKSTFLRCLNGLVTATTGDVLVDGVRVTGGATDAVRRVRARIGFVFQQFNLVRRLTVLENVLIGRLARVAQWRSLVGWFPAMDVERAQSTLARVGLGDLAARRADTLSGGQQQRVAIARALVQEPAIILADEPMASLDPALSRTVMELLRQINREDGITIVASLHVLELAAGYAHRIVALREGRVAFDGPADSLSDEGVERVFGPRG